MAKCIVCGKEIPEGKKCCSKECVQANFKKLCEARRAKLKGGK